MLYIFLDNIGIPIQDKNNSMNGKFAYNRYMFCKERITFLFDSILLALRTVNSYRFTNIQRLKSKRYRESYFFHYSNRMGDRELLAKK